MALIEANDSIKEYYNQVKDKYPDISYEQFEQICKSPFRFIKLKMEDSSTPRIIIKYFGKFFVSSGKLKKLVKKLNTKKHFNQINDERYTKFKANLEEKIKIVEADEHDRKNKRNINRKETSD